MVVLGLIRPEVSKETKSDELYIKIEEMIFHLQYYLIKHEYLQVF